MDHVMDKIGNQVSMIHDIEENFSGIRSGLTGLEQNAAAILEKTRILRETNTMLVDETNTLSSTSEEISASAEETNAMCTDNAERFKSVNNVIAELAAEAGKMNGFIEEYHRLHDADTNAETAISRQALHTGIERGGSAIHADVRKKSASFCRLPGVTIRLSTIARFLPCRLEHPGSCLLPRFDTLCGVCPHSKDNEWTFGQLLAHLFTDLIKGTVAISISHFALISNITRK